MNDSNYSGDTVMQASSDVSEKAETAISAISDLKENLATLNGKFNFLDSGDLWSGNKKDEISSKYEAIKAKMDDLTNNIDSLATAIKNIDSALSTVEDGTAIEEGKSFDDVLKETNRDLSESLHIYFVGECANYETRAEKIAYLFEGNGLPTNKGAAGHYMTDIEVPVKIYDENGNLVDATKTVTVHEKLADDYYAIFQELADIGYPMAMYSLEENGPVEIDPAGGAFCFRGKTDNSSEISEHGYGTAIDINVPYNPFTTNVNTNVDSPYMVTPEVVEIFRKHGFSWGGDWNWTTIKDTNGQEQTVSVGKHDYMHFTYLGC